MTTSVRTVVATRYVTPLREGGSMPALVEADDDGLYVVKLRGAGQGTPVLVAELISAELARAAGLRVPEVVKVDLDTTLGKNEPDYEVRELLMKSGGLNLGLDFLPGSVTYDPAADPRPDAALASLLVLFDSFIMNPDRSAKNTNLLRWQSQLWLIDHGAALYFQYGWQPDAPLAGARTPFSRIRDHVMLHLASDLAGAAQTLAKAWSPKLIERIVVDIEDAWLDPVGSGLPTRDAWCAWLCARLEALSFIAEEAARARATVI